MRVYPRTRGETGYPAIVAVVLLGLSPHARGNLIIIDHIVVAMGSIPARAGKPISEYRSPIQVRVYPRTRGETARGVEQVTDFEGLSPHARGNQ